MGLREFLKDKKAIAMVVTIVAICAVGWNLLGRAREKTGAPTQAFFTVDDGATFFTDDSSKIPPFDHGGKPAYGCVVYTNDGGATKYVVSMYRYTPQGKQMLERMKSSSGGDFGRMALNSIEVKRPGTGEDAWISSSDPRAAAIQRPPPSKSGTPTPVSP